MSKGRWGCCGLWVTQVGREGSPHHKARGHFVDTIT